MISSVTFGLGFRIRKPTAASASEYLRQRIFVLVLVLLTVGDVIAQQPFGTIVGTVTDQTGARLSAATVVVTNTDMEVSKTVVTNATGDYSVPYLLNGTYLVKAEHPGFRTAIMRQVVLQTAQTLRA